MGFSGERERVVGRGLALCEMTALPFDVFFIGWAGGGQSEHVRGNLESWVCEGSVHVQSCLTHFQGHLRNFTQVVFWWVCRVGSKFTKGRDEFWWDLRIDSSKILIDLDLNYSSPNSMHRLIKFLDNYFWKSSLYKYNFWLNSINLMDNRNSCTIAFVYKDIILN